VLDPLAAETVLSTGTADASGAQGPKWRRVDFTVPVSGQSTLRLSWTGTADMRADGNPSNDPDTVPLAQTLRATRQCAGGGWP